MGGVGEGLGDGGRLDAATDGGIEADSEGLAVAGEVGDAGADVAGVADEPQAAVSTSTEATTHGSGPKRARRDRRSVGMQTSMGFRRKGGLCRRLETTIPFPR